MTKIEKGYIHVKPQYLIELQGRPYVRKRSILLIASQLIEGAKFF